MKVKNLVPLMQKLHICFIKVSNKFMFHVIFPFRYYINLQNIHPKALLFSIGTDNQNQKLIYSWPGPEVIKLEYSLKLKIKRNDWMLADTCLQASNHCALF